MGISGACILAFLIWALFGGYAHRSIDMLMRNLRYKEADGDVIRVVESWAHKTNSLIDVLGWGLFIMTIFTITSIAMNYFLSCKLAKANALLKNINEG